MDAGEVDIFYIIRTVIVSLVAVRLWRDLNASLGITYLPTRPVDLWCVSCEPNPFVHQQLTHSIFTVSLFLIVPANGISGCLGDGGTSKFLSKYWVFWDQGKEWGSCPPQEDMKEGTGYSYHRLWILDCSSAGVSRETSQTLRISVKPMIAEETERMVWVKESAGWEPILEMGDKI